jgi:multicomponent Na+:H+ antiporter subunit C
MDLVEGYYAHFFLMLLFVIGLYGMMMKRNYLKKCLGMGILQMSVIMFWILVAFKEGATLPVFDPAIGADDPALYLNPLPHTLMLTAIVVAVVMLGVSFALVVGVYRNYGTLDERELLERMREE